MRKLFKEPLVHFLLLGAALFLAFELTGESEQSAARRIVVSAGQVDQLTAQFSRTWMRQPTEDELAKLIEQHLRSEVFYREALAMGLDQGDPYVRNRLALKLEFLLDDLYAATAPTDETLAGFLKEHADLFIEPARLSFEQVYLNPERHADPKAEAARRLERLRSGVEPDGLGDPTLRRGSFMELSREGIAREFGGEFADALMDLEPGDWRGPSWSTFGYHLVKVTARQPARLPALEEIRAAVLAEWQDRRRLEAREQAYLRLREGYEIVIEADAQTASSPVPGGSESTEVDASADTAAVALPRTAPGGS